MSDDVKSSRTYRSAVREDRARRTRRAIVEAATESFLDIGFAATTMPRVAASAGVSVQTVYKLFGNKPALAKAAFDVAIAGDDQSVPVVDRARLAAVRQETDPRLLLARYGSFLTAVAPRHVPLQLVIRDASANHPDAAQVWAELQAERLRGMTTFARALHRRGHLRTGMSAAEARDILWTYNSAELFDLLVLQRGWSARRYGRWVADALAASLL